MLATILITIINQTSIFITYNNNNNYVIMVQTKGIKKIKLILNRFEKNKLNFPNLILKYRNHCTKRK